MLSDHGVRGYRLADHVVQGCRPHKSAIPIACLQDKWRTMEYTGLPPPASPNAEMEKTRNGPGTCKRCSSLDLANESHSSSPAPPPPQVPPVSALFGHFSSLLATKP